MTSKKNQRRSKSTLKRESSPENHQLSEGPSPILIFIAVVGSIILLSAIFAAIKVYIYPQGLEGSGIRECGAQDSPNSTDCTQVERIQNSTENETNKLNSSALTNNA